MVNPDTRHGTSDNGVNFTDAIVSNLNPQLYEKGEDLFRLPKRVTDY